MKMWCRDFSDAQFTDAAMDDAGRYRGITLMSGRSVADRFPSDASIISRRKRPPCDYFLAGPFPVVSSKLRTVLDSFAVDAEYLPVAVESPNAQYVAGDWYCFNVLNVADCLDRERSVFTPEREFATKIKEIVLQEEYCTGPLMLIAKAIPFLLVARDDVADAVATARCTGVVLKNPEDWTTPTQPVRQ